MKIMIQTLIVLVIALLGSHALAADKIKVYSVEKGSYVMSEKIEKSKEEWKNELTPQQYRILRGAGTEPAFSGKFWDHHARGTYVCAGCGLDLFSSETKFESGTGWPSFYKPIAPENIVEREDRKLWMVRTEVLCARCEGHLGHVFEDGPEPTGLRYCLNSAALEFNPSSE